MSSFSYPQRLNHSLAESQVERRLCLRSQVLTMNPRDKKPGLLERLKQYGERSTIHGVSYTLDSAFSRYRSRPSLEQHVR